MGLTIPQMALMSRLLDEALPLDADARRRWLEALAPEHRALAAALREALLPAAANDRVAGVLEAGARLCLERLGSGPSAGESVGPYRLVRLLGKGGMAEVWLAQRADGAFTREVALKLPILAQLRNDLASRFARERDILAALEHPNIARLYDAGVSATGLPYLAMEYVAGQPLITWCDARRLGIRERLELFQQVLDALRYAHERQVIHRDIKPSNILVSDSGQVCLLDFGVAKLLSKEHEQTNLTQRYGRVLTPDYASPEQLRGERILVTTDVYALGVVLYELLAGSRPYALQAGAPITLLEDSLRTTVVKRPSAQISREAARDRGTTARKLVQRLKGDLDAIVLQALAKAPVDRYASAAALAEDLQRSVRGEPVYARAESVSYLFGKFVVRHRGFVAASAVATVVIAITLGFGVLDTNDVKTPPAVDIRAAAHATTAAPPEKSIAVLPFTDLSEKKDQEYFSDGLSEQLIDHLVHSADLKVIARTSSFKFKGKNEDVRSIARQLGVSHVLEGSVLKAGQQLRITAELIRASDGVNLWSQTYDRDLADIFKVQDEIGEKVSSALHAALRSGNSSGSQTPDIRAYNLVLEGNYFKDRRTSRDMEKAIELYRQALDISPDYALAWARLASAYMNSEILQGLPSEAQDGRILDALDRAIRLDPNLAWAYYARGGFELNVAWNWEAGQADMERMRTVDPQFELVSRTLGDIARIFGDVDKAARFYQTDFERNPLDPDTLDSLGVALCAANRLQECLQMRLRLAQFFPQYGNINYSIGLAHLALGQLAAALQAMQREDNTQSRLAGLAMVYSATGRLADSDAALKLLTDKYAASDAYKIAEVHASRGDADEAFQWLDRAYRQHDFGLIDVKADPLLRKVRGDPRFQALLGRMRLAGRSRSDQVDAQI